MRLLNVFLSSISSLQIFRYSVLTDDTSIEVYIGGCNSLKDFALLYMCM